MFTRREKQLIEDGYFTIIRNEDKYIEVRSKNTRHQWIIYKNSFDSNKPVTLYHKHRADVEYYHRHWETWTVELAVKSIKNHDNYVMNNGKKVKWMKKKGRSNYGGI